MRSGALFVWALVPLLLSGESRAASAVLQRLQAAHTQVKAKEYDRAIARTKPLLDGLKLSTVEEIILAHRILGVAHCELGDQAAATEHYEALLTFSPSESVEDLASTKPCVQLFAETRSRKEGQPLPAAEPAPPTAAAGATAAAPQTEPAGRVERGEGKWKLYVPYGVGQFRNAQKAKGMAFLSTEAAATILAVTMGLLFASEKGPDGTFAHPERASVYRGFFWGSLGVGIGAAAWGIIDAVAADKRRARTSLSFGADPLGPSVALNF